MGIVRKIVVVIQKVAHRILQWPSKAVHQIYSIDIIRTRRENSRAESVRAHNSSLSVLRDDERLLGQSLVEDGFCVTEAEMFGSFGDAKFQAAANEIYNRMEEHYLGTGRSIDAVKLLSMYPSLLDQFKVVFRAGLDIRLLAIIEHYLKLPVAYGGVDVFFTIADGSERGARTWHRDSEDNPMVKVAVYLNDVDESGGPLEILHLQHVSAESKRFRGFMHQKLEKLESEGKIKFKITSFVGSKGTVILCDTFKYFHRGKPATGQNRRALFFNYYGNKPLTPYFCPNPPFSAHKMEDLVSDLSAKQRDAALWRETLTGFDRWVTKKKPYLNV
ncbi:hypothetical protein LOK46_31805 (plasmid) [Methylobacterium sp. NMS14P]|uniref:hypothetical protein n=1 Tax=Methylobacterium sp. NMS14P TaxID=2894310 RepID=UPI00235817AD|nr:hypothetical protein [Methylobacterium sp. NMS14P]WCS28504.1 hypothetical protein LOK46_31805 [Methylobacterium sp. NMS14P]